MIKEFEDILKSSFVNPCEKSIVWMHKLGLLNEEQTRNLLMEYTQLNVNDGGNNPFPNGIWSVYIGDRGEHFPPHIHIHNRKLNFTCRFDINTCKTIYEEEITDELQIIKNRIKRTDNYHNIRGISFEEISERLRTWYNNKF